MPSLFCRLGAVTLLLVATTGPAAACTLPVIQYFAQGSSAVDERSALALTTIVSWLKRNADGVTEIRVTGHSDRTGSRGARLAISLARAEAVRDKLVGYGVPVGLVVVRAAGDAEPAVETADGVSEPDNRRTEIHVTMTYEWIAGQRSRPAPPPGSIYAC